MRHDFLSSLIIIYLYFMRMTYYSLDTPKRCRVVFVGKRCAMLFFQVSPFTDKTKKLLFGVSTRL